MNNNMVTDSGSVSFYKDMLPLLFFVIGLCGITNISSTFTNPSNSLPVSGNIIASEMDKNIRIVQLESARQTGVRCGFYALFNARAVANIFEEGSNVFDSDDIKIRIESLFSAKESDVQGYENIICKRAKDENVAALAEGTDLLELAEKEGLFTYTDVFSKEIQTFFINNNSLYPLSGENWNKSLQKIRREPGIIHMISHIGSVQGGHWIYIGIIHTNSDEPFIIMLDSLNNDLLSNESLRRGAYTLYKQLYPNTSIQQYFKQSSPPEKYKERAEERTEYRSNVEPQQREQRESRSSYTPSYRSFGQSYSSYSHTTQKSALSPTSGQTRQTHEQKKDMPDKSLIKKHAERSQTYHIGKVTIKIILGDLTKQKNVDAVVNAANKNLNHAGGLAGVLHIAAGPEMQKESFSIVKADGPLEIGEAVETGAYNLSKNGVQYIIHAVGPDCRIKKQKKHMRPLLEFAYQNTLELAQELGIKSIAFPSLNTGIYACSLDIAVPLALQTVLHELISAIKNKTNSLKEIRFVLLTEDEYNLYIKQMDTILKNPALLK